MDEIVLSKELADIIDRCLNSIDKHAEKIILYGIKIYNKEQFMLNPNIPEGNLLERIYNDIDVKHDDINEFKQILDENPEEDIFEFIYELNLSINNFKIKDCQDITTSKDILVIQPKSISIAGFSELYEFMKKLKEDKRIPLDTTIGPVYWETY
jgi:hypothetical protein